MPISEFDLIREYFSRRISVRDDVIIGIGDDAAILQPPAGMALAISMDTLVDGVHFDQHSGPYSIGWKAAAVNLSDMAATGAEPAWATLSLTLPEVKADWLREFSNGLFEMLSRFDVELVGGDTSRGPLSMTVQLHGFVPVKQALGRNGARPGDMLYLTDTVGEAGLALWCRQQQIDLPQPYGRLLMARLDRPEPRINEGVGLRELASSAIDISDGLLADLGHVCTASQVGAVINVGELPRSPAFSACAQALLDQGLLNEEKLLSFQLSGGDDYELCFSVPLDRCHDLDSQATYHCIGGIEEGDGVRCRDKQGNAYQPQCSGFDHFF